MLLPPAVPRSGKQPPAPAESGAWPHPMEGGLSRQPCEPQAILSEALGSHLELLGRELRQRAAEPPRPPTGSAATREEAARCHDVQRSMLSLLALLYPSLPETTSLRDRKRCECERTTATGSSNMHFAISDVGPEASEAGTPRSLRSPQKADDSGFAELFDTCAAQSARAGDERSGTSEVQESMSNVSATSPSTSPHPIERSRSKKRTTASIFTISDKRTPERRGSSVSEGAQNFDIHAALNQSDTSISKKTRLQDFVTHAYFETVFGVLVAINTLFMIMEEQYAGSRAGYDVGYYEHYGSDSFNSKYVFFGEQDLFTYTELTFTVIFTLEAILRMFGRRRAYWTDPYELLDLGVVVCSIVVIFLQIYLGGNVAIFRLLRSVKVLRMVKLIRRLKGMDSLQLMTTALSASGFALLWAIVLLFIMQSVVALILTSLFRTQYLMVPGLLTNEQRVELFQYFGTYSRSMLSMFELTLANWPPISRFLTESLHEGWMLFAVAYKLTFGFAVVGVINAVFVQETFNVASSDDSIMVKRKQRAASTHRKKMDILFKKLDATGRGSVNRRDFRRVLQDRSIATWLEAMDLDASDSNVLFALLDKDGDKTISVEELCTGAARLKGGARSFDVQLVIKALKEQWDSDKNGSPGADPHRHDVRNYISQNSAASSCLSE